MLSGQLLINLLFFCLYKEVRFAIDEICGVYLVFAFL